MVCVRFTRKWNTGFKLEELIFTCDCDEIVSYSCGWCWFWVTSFALTPKGESQREEEKLGMEAHPHLSFCLSARLSSPSWLQGWLYLWTFLPASVCYSSPCPSPSPPVFFSFHLSAHLLPIQLAVCLFIPLFSSPLPRRQMINIIKSKMCSLMSGRTGAI